MRLTTYWRLALQTVILVLSIVPAAIGETEGLPQGHTKFTSIVTKKGGALVVTTPNGATHQLNANMARRHGQKPFKSGMRSLWCWMKTTTSSICISKERKDNINT